MSSSNSHISTNVNVDDDMNKTKYKDTSEPFQVSYVEHINFIGFLYSTNESTGNVNWLECGNKNFPEMSTQTNNNDQ